MKRSALLISTLLFFASYTVFAQKKNLNIVYIGDSITQGAQLKDPVNEGPTATASAYLRTKNDIGKVAFSNNGLSGFTTVDFLPSTNKAFNTVEQAANAFEDKSAELIFSIMLGTNDSASTTTNGAPVSDEQFHDNLKAIIDRLLLDFPNCKVIIQPPTWYSPTTYNGARYLQEGLTRLQSYFPQIEKLANEYSATHPKQVFAGNKKAFKYFKENYLTTLNPEEGRQGTFYLHPNKKGDEALGAFWADVIYKAARKN
jgi:lysophospholipase L1-like esterase